MNWEEASEELSGGATIASPSRGIAYKNVWINEDDCETVIYGIWEEGGRIRIDVYDCYGECIPGTNEDIATADWVLAW